MYEDLKKKYEEIFKKESEYIFASPGRTELAGNHTDHEGGCVIAGAIDVVIKAAVGHNNEDKIDIFSENFGRIELSLDDLEVKKEDYNSSLALIRGVAARFKELGKTIGGFNAYIVSDVDAGSGLSSSAAFENLIGSIINDLFDNDLSFVDIAQTSKFAENVYFGKPCGLMDQMASAAGALSRIDFHDPDNPIIERININFKDYGYDLCIIKSGADHADLTDEYSLITDDMLSVSKHFGQKRLMDIDEDEFWNTKDLLIEQYGERAVKRCIHIFNDNKRVALQAEALKNGDIDEYLRLVNESGISSKDYLQNVIPIKDPSNTKLSDAIDFAKELLSGKGAVRVHGGGFAGTLQAYVPCEMTNSFVAEIEKKLGKGSCMIVAIRENGSGRVE